MCTEDQRAKAKTDAINELIACADAKANNSWPMFAFRQHNNYADCVIRSLRASSAARRNPATAVVKSAAPAPELKATGSMVKMKASPADDHRN